MAHETNSVIFCHSVDQWKEQLELALESKKLVVIDFTASWCVPCRVISPFFYELSKRYPTIMFLKVDVDELGAIAKEMKIEVMPTFVYMRGGEVLYRLLGANKDQLSKRIKKYLALASVTADAK